MIIKDKEFKDKTYVMAIINFTPDSFWAASRKNCDDVLFAVERAVKDGAALVDLGAQSTRPGYTEVDAKEEIRRLEKPLYLVKKNFDIPVSVDTYFSECAEAALSLGADMINDIWGLTHDGNMADVIARYGASVCIMHNAKQPLTGDIWRPIENFLQNSVLSALSAGIDKERICIDGGIGFAKNREQNLELLNGYGRLSCLSYPLLLGTSRKSLFGGMAQDRLEATLQSTRKAVKDKVLFVRVHDVKENVLAIKEAEEE